jgi:hypothetical protein
MTTTEMKLGWEWRSPGLSTKKREHWRRSAWM